MVRRINIAMMVVSMLLLGHMGARAVYAQPLGFGGSKAAEQPKYEILSSPKGRFVFGQISASSKDQFMLDTATGRLWRVGESGKVGIFLKAVPYLDTDGKCTFLPDKVPDSASKTPERK
ncbi:MAG: hypothetical protein JRL30_19900 [Deltaproteobacteria bacterium]|nr:hypothetical protein [Deltaproteobacteria bacterium]